MGRAGVAVLSPHPIRDVRVGVGPREFKHSGRWVEATIDTNNGPLTAVSVYVHKGEVDTPRQLEKFRFLDAMTRRMTALRLRAESEGGQVIVGGDLNVAHTESDIKNWKGNRGKSGFLEPERAYLDKWFAKHWVDLGRAHAGDCPGPYTWWSWRGRAFDGDAGWRIDYLLATQSLAARLERLTIGRADSYAHRWSDHAALTASFTRM